MRIDIDQDGRCAAGDHGMGGARPRERRHDYFVAYKTWMPQLNPGRYTLELLVEDAIAGKIGTSTIDFEIVSR